MRHHHDLADDPRRHHQTHAEDPVRHDDYRPLPHDRRSHSHAPTHNSVVGGFVNVAIGTLFAAHMDNQGDIRRRSELRTQMTRFVWPDPRVACWLCTIASGRAVNARDEPLMSIEAFDTHLRRTHGLIHAGMVTIRPETAPVDVRDLLIVPPAQWPDVPPRLPVLLELDDTVQTVTGAGEDGRLMPAQIRALLRVKGYRAVPLPSAESCALYVLRSDDIPRPGVLNRRASAWTGYKIAGPTLLGRDKIDFRRFEP